jgi:hypothetical protein
MEIIVSNKLQNVFVLSPRQSGFVARLLDFSNTLFPKPLCDARILLIPSNQ